MSAEPNLVVNGDFATGDLTGWDHGTQNYGTIDIIGNNVSFQVFDSGDSCFISQPIWIKSNTNYRFEFVVVLSRASGFNLSCGVGTTNAKYDRVLIELLDVIPFDTISRNYMAGNENINYVNFLVTKTDKASFPPTNIIFEFGEIGLFGLPPSTPPTPPTPFVPKVIIID